MLQASATSLTSSCGGHSAFAHSSVINKLRYPPELERDTCPRTGLPQILVEVSFSRKVCDICVATLTRTSSTWRATVVLSWHEWGIRLVISISWCTPSQKGDILAAGESFKQSWDDEPLVLSSKINHLRFDKGCFSSKRSCVRPVRSDTPFRICPNSCNLR